MADCKICGEVNPYEHCSMECQLKEIADLQAQVAEYKQAQIDAINENQVNLHRANAAEAQVAGLEEQSRQDRIFFNELMLMAIEWQDEDNYCPSQCNHTESCGETLQEMLRCHTAEAKAKEGL